MKKVVVISTSLRPGSNSHDRPENLQGRVVLEIDAVCF